jgi:putative ABC transport system substrate-binding protein
MGASQITINIARRKFIAALGGSAFAWPLTASAQQPSMPVIGFLNAASAPDYVQPLRAFLNGLKEAGYVDGQNAKIEYLWANGRIDLLPAMAAALVHNKVTVIAATSTAAALAAKAATTTIPIVFETGADPVKLGLVPGLNHQGGNVTGVTQLTQEVAPKLLELLHELLPAARIMALLVNPNDPALAEATTREMLGPAQTLGLEFKILHASNERDFDVVFAKLIELRAGALVIGGEPLFTSHSEQLAALALRHRVHSTRQ